MKKVKVIYEVYRFKELGRKAKALLAQHKIKGEPTLGYSLSCSQGDGLNFTGDFEWKGYQVKITHSWRYPFASASEIALYDKEGEEVEEGKVAERFKTLYLQICKELEKEGYGVLDYRMDDKEFAEHCEVNEYNFFKNGRMANLK